MTTTPRRLDRPSLLLLLLLSCATLLVEAQSPARLLSQVPDCAVPRLQLECITQGLNDGNCNLTSVATIAGCLCPNIKLQSDLSTCVQLKCHFEDQARAAQVETSLCEAYPKESRSHEVKAVAIALSVITFPVVALRCISRWMITNRLWWDDWTAVFATMLLAGLAGVEIASADLGFGTHYWNVEPAAGTKLIQLFYAVQQLYILIQVSAKISILLFFSRIFPARWFKLTVRYFIGFLLLHGLVFLLVIIFQCTPVSSTWDRSDPNRKCMDVTAIGYAGAVFSIIEDLVILALPIPELVKLQLNIRKKIALGFMFSLGSFACITTMVRLKYLVMFSSTFDTTWDNVDIVIWSLAESFCAILCASLPALRPLLQKVPRLFTTERSSAKGLSSNQSRRSMLNVGKDRFHEILEASVDMDSPATPIDIADQMAAKADGKRQVLITRDKEVDLRADVELQSVRPGQRWQKNDNGKS
ncbi:hypothetical protein CCHL11_07980 [Colletotrichum chlorophyti]|uniref:CFEM domain-containing protein n=1 Tax=Colletotrichum chlorophyti TaxID=708187 RepID=A0A1Q8RM66_9PEZI|nr:hypothetical protein CCHL11_07980 [Colletotrichum chlorophyti]